MAVLDSILNGIQTHIVVTSPPPHIQSSLLRILNEVDNVVSDTSVERVGEGGREDYSSVTPSFKGFHAYFRFFHMRNG